MTVETDGGYRDLMGHTVGVVDHKKNEDIDF